MGHLVKATAAFGALLLVLGAAWLVTGIQREGDALQERIQAAPYPGGAFLQSSGSTSWESWLGIKPPQADALYHYAPGVDARELAFQLRDALSADGWDAKVIFPNDPAVAAAVEATREGAFLHAKFGRWGDALGGCCVASDDPTRPIGMRVELYPPT